MSFSFIRKLFKKESWNKVTLKFQKMALHFTATKTINKNLVNVLKFTNLNKNTVSSFK